MTQSLTKNCPHCKATIDSAAKKCQHCQTDLRNWIVRHPVWTGVLGLIVIPILVSAVNDTNQTRTTANTQTTNAPQTTGETRPTDEIKTVGGSQTTANANDIAKRTLDSLSVTAIKIEENSIGTPQLYVTVQNNSKKTVDAFTIAVDLYNNYDEQLGEFNRPSKEPYRGISQTTIKPGAVYQERFNLAVYDHTTKAKNPRIIKVHFTDGTGAESDY